MINGMLKLLKQNRSFLLFMLLMLVFRSAVADWNSVPTGSMKPTILEGDRLLVNKMAYDLRVPFTHLSLVKMADPARGEIIIFDSVKADKKLVKRVIGIPGDLVEMKHNRLIINGKPLKYHPQKKLASSADSIEQLLGVDHMIRTHDTPSRLADFGPVTVPDNFYLALGDNRDASADSRVIGFIPRNEITGRAKTVAFSNDHNNYYLFRPERFMHTL
ncbi:signal peptidase I [Shewanella eurypsychrophilus]|uniref:Signal peptidase I n=1 Tax=Shewanella eurypsychrophilus TaxID=2593656 RepID=A0ABX6VEB9_9GAMM|nr:MULTISPECIES: signal peptidase I [Shewanella]QFU24673.1 signal peptidase I [Shewanella sp. YLB-09]QPG59865.1 signal peptidase I [Shewanella eurypsychrophilus]